MIGVIGGSGLASPTLFLERRDTLPVKPLRDPARRGVPARDPRLNDDLLAVTPPPASTRGRGPLPPGRPGTSAGGRSPPRRPSRQNSESPTRPCAPWTTTATESRRPP